jgi:hypothetical protein
MTEDYARRVIDDELDDLLTGLPAVAIDGPKAVGKTTTAVQRAATVLRLEDEVTRRLLAADPDRLSRGPGLVLLDEWQRWPESWDRVRRLVDDGVPAGRFLLTGSAVPAGVPTHSGAGRIVRLRMRPLSLAERGLVTPTVRLSDLLGGHGPAVGGESPVSLPDYAEEIAATGLPGIRTLPRGLRAAQLDGYVASIVERDFPDQGQPVRRPGALRAWLAAYGAASGTTASYQSILGAATPGEADKPARTTVQGYRDVLEQLWLLDPVPGWVPAFTPLTRLAAAPKHHLADPGLAAHLLGLDPASLLAGRRPRAARGEGLVLGQLFESLVTQSVRVYAQQHRSTVSHLRTRNGDHEVDLVLERPDGGVLAIEVKLALTVDDSDVRHLLWLRDRLGDDLVDAVVVTSGPHAYRRPDGVAVVPAALLGP